MDFDQNELFAVFVAESEENLAMMEHGLLQLEKQPDDGETIDLVFRATHTVKGNSSSLGFDAVAELAHEMENLLDGVRAGRLRANGDLVSLLLAATDVIRRWLPLLRADAPAVADEAQRAMIGQLRSFKPLPVAQTLLSAASGAAGKSAGAAPTARTLRIEATRLDALLDLAGEITIAAERVRRRVEALPDEQRRETIGAVEECEALLFDLHEKVMRCRMVPIGPTFRRHFRTVRDLARAKNKEARLVIEGEDVEVDMTVAEALVDPLVHMVRNAIDHGIEEPEARRAAGKEPMGTIRLTAAHERGTIVVSIVDDGAGIPLDKVRARAREHGIDVTGLGSEQLVELIFHPGFSTADSITGTSGRGVGMDVVRRNIERVRGRIEVDTMEGAGTVVTMRLPLTLAVIPGFVVSVAGEQFVIPLPVVDECLELTGSTPDASGLMHVRGEGVPFVRLRQFLGFGGSSATREVAVIVDHFQARAGLVVDEVIGEAQVVVKPPGSMLRGVTGVTGTAVMGSGAVALVLDTTAIFREVEKKAAVA